MFTTSPSLPADVQMFLVMKFLWQTRIVVGRGKRMSRIHSVARTVCSRRRISGRALDLVSGQESFLALSNRADASFKFARASYLLSGELWSTVRMEHRAFGENSLSSPQSLEPSLA